jgi:hypothetical protein
MIWDIVQYLDMVKLHLAKHRLKAVVDLSPAQVQQQGTDSKRRKHNDKH